MAWVPRDIVNSRALKEHFAFTMFEDKTCDRCEYKQERPNDVCETCNAYNGILYLYHKKLIGDVKYYGLPLGNQKLLEKAVPGFSKLAKKDERACPKANTKFKFTGNLRPYQVIAVKALVNKKTGILKAAPRTGKTVMATAITAELGLKTLILVHQHDLALQALEHFHSNDFTDILATEKFIGKPIVGICKTFKDFVRYDVCITTYQGFLKNPKRLKAIQDLFGLVITDEVHRGNALGYSRVVASFNSMYKIGLTGTVVRKDQRHFVMNAIIGPVSHEVITDLMKPYVRMVETDIKGNDYKLWVHMLRYLEGAKGRNQLIVQHVVRDLKMGYHILIPSWHVSHINDLTELINKAVGKEVAVAYHGKVTEANRWKIIEGARSGKIRVVVARRTMLLGVNVPKWDCLYNIMPISNQPNYEQEVQRICTPMENKKEPKVKFFIDDMGVCRACFRTCCATFKKLGFKWEDRDHKIMRATLAKLSPKYNPNKDQFKPERTIGRRF